MEDSRELRSMRYMAWERAKGELRSMIHTYWGGCDSKFKEINEKIESFIRDVEDHGSCE